MSDIQKIKGIVLNIEASIPAEAVRIICREFIRIFLTDGLKTCLCPAHAAVHPELQNESSDAGAHMCVFCGAGLNETEGLSAL